MKRVNIGICDDKRESLDILQTMIQNVCRGLDWVCEIRSFLNGVEMLEQIEEFQVVFLDIEMPGLDGIELGKQIKDRNPKCQIIMATGMVERFKEAFRIQAFRFITKPFSYSEVKEALGALKSGQFFLKFIDVYMQRIKYEISEEEIHYIRSYDGYAEVQVGEKCFRRNSSLDELEKMLDERLFARISREVLVNLRWVQEVSSGSVLLGGKKLHVSRRREGELRRKYIEYDIRYREIIGG